MNKDRFDLADILYDLGVLEKKADALQSSCGELKTEICNTICHLKEIIKVRLSNEW